MTNPRNTRILFNAQALSSPDRNSDLKTDGMQASEPKKDKNWTTCTGAFVSRVADYIYAQNDQRLQLVLISQEQMR